MRGGAVASRLDWRGEQVDPPARRWRRPHTGTAHQRAQRGVQIVVRDEAIAVGEEARLGRRGARGRATEQRARHGEQRERRVALDLCGCLDRERPVLDAMVALPRGCRGPG